MEQPPSALSCQPERGRRIGPFSLSEMREGTRTGLSPTDRAITGTPANLDGLPPKGTR